MKNIDKYILVSLFFILGCEDHNNALNQISFKSEGSCMVAMSEDIGINFCLLDTEGNQRNTFRKDKNFIFNMTLTNRTQDTMIVHPDFIDTSFYLVQSTFNNIEFGKPYTGVWCEFSGKAQGA